MEKKDLKPGNLVVITKDYGGNQTGTITKVVSLLQNNKKAEKEFGNINNVIACEAVTSPYSKVRSPKDYNLILLRIGFKTPCWIEIIKSLRLATKKERQQYYKELQAHLENVNC